MKSKMAHAKPPWSILDPVKKTSWSTIHSWSCTFTRRTTIPHHVTAGKENHKRRREKGNGDDETKQREIPREIPDDAALRMPLSVSDFWISKRTREKKRGSQLSSFSCITFSNRRSSFFWSISHSQQSFCVPKKREREKNKKEKEAQTIFQKRTWWSFFFFSSNPQLSHDKNYTTSKNSHPENVKLETKLWKLK